MYQYWYCQVQKYRTFATNLNVRQEYLECKIKSFWNPEVVFKQANWQ